MPTLSCRLGPEGVGRLHDAILCLAKFNDMVGVEIHHDRLILAALHTSKSAYASFTLKKDSFFQAFTFRPNDSIGQSAEDDRSVFMCQLFNKALLSVFRGRQVDGRAGGASVEKCEIDLEDSADKAQCRLIVKIICKHGVKKTYKLTYEVVEVRHAVFSRATAKNHWTIEAHVLRSFSEYFGTNTEQLDMYYEAGRFTFTSYTEKVMNGNEILRKPLQTSITVDNFDFEDLSVEEKVHIAISVKDFKNIVTHAETLKATVTASYSFPSKPMQLTYTEHGIQCDFVLMTIGESRARSVTPSSALAQQASVRPSARQESIRPALDNTVVRNSTIMPPPLQPASRSFRQEPSSQRQSRPSPQPPPASVPHESLFIPANDDDSVWGEKNFDEEEDQLGWGDSADKGSFTTSLHRSSRSRLVPPKSSSEVTQDEQDRRVPPTQRISEISGLFDD